MTPIARITGSGLRTVRNVWRSRGYRRSLADRLLRHRAPQRAPRWATPGPQEGANKWPSVGIVAHSYRRERPAQRSFLGINTDRR